MKASTDRIDTEEIQCFGIAYTLENGDEQWQELGEKDFLLVLVDYAAAGKIPSIDFHDSDTLTIHDNGVFYA